ncbi:ectoine/hydroxyectoine ABC transporter substrate-binding protein EhuB [Lentibacillus amyloliquefaciens]|uniref:Ectoine/hydroxyectoine ABC transporter substrate-binding protein EhuB n=1 Tax=Lentibacillus amyloliquefaciens TaxID=1472767 RepID=A0A0U4F111_9BACI|nr:ectoine/hydroxyectoine ABC transporter substrate-binding protein EhuB [Lentibacillus amyloliquefaciens]ALX49191.1 ectoine/hydroxyectoine ABC transporter substrate-binding protein EhuB [Lentibacillus amyloliquefaciens]
MKKLLAASIFGILILFLAACGGGSDDSSGSDDGSSGDSGSESESSGDSKLAEIQESGTVTVGFANEEPYGYQGEDGELTGASPEITKAVFAELGVDNMDGQLADFGQLIPGLNAGNYDVVTAAMAINPDRCENADFGEPEMTYGEGIVVPEGNPMDIHSYSDIAESGANVSIMSGATEIGYAQEMGVSEDQIQEAADIPSTISAVQSGRADVTTATEMTLRMAMETASGDVEFVEDFEQPDIEGVPSYGAAVFHQDNDELREAYNEELQKLIDDGTVAEILENNGFDPESNAPPEDITTEQICSGEEY